jgi:DNA-binding NarL/FixJ family response regulator
VLTPGTREPAVDSPTVYVDLLDTTQRLAMTFVAGEAGWVGAPSVGSADLHVADRLAEEAAPPLDVLVVPAVPAPSRRAVDAFTTGRVRAVVDAAVPDELPIALSLLRTGLGVVPTRIVDAANRVPALRPRLERTLQLVLRGQSNRVIARAVHESEATAKRDVGELLRLFDAPNRLALATTAIRLGYQLDPGWSASDAVP